MSSGVSRSECSTDVLAECETLKARAHHRGSGRCRGEVEDSALLDAALIAAAQAVEHYEITRYGSLIAWAQLLGRNDCASVLQQTLDEEKATDKKLTALAESRLNRRAA